MKSNITKWLNGTSQGVIIALVPAAVFLELFKLMARFFECANEIVMLLQATNSLLGLAIGVSVAYAFKLSMIEMLAVGFSTFLSGGAIHYHQSVLMLSGTGDLLTMMMTSAISVFIIRITRRFIKGYALLLTSSLVVLSGGVFGKIILPYFKMFSHFISEGIVYLLSLEQTVMSILLAIIFAYLIVSPLSSAGIALAVGLSGVGAGAANLGICATMFSLAIGGRKVNALGVCLAHVFASPKLSMTNMMTKPLLFIPIAINAAVLGGLASLFSIQGTPFSAGLGLIGLVGPIAHLSQTSFSSVNVLLVSLLFVIVPIMNSYSLDKLFKNRLKLISDHDYRVQI